MSTFPVDCAWVVQQVPCVDTSCILLVRSTWHRVTEKEPRNLLDIEKQSGRAVIRFLISSEPKQTLGLVVTSYWALPLIIDLHEKEIIKEWNEQEKTSLHKDIYFRNIQVKAELITPYLLTPWSRALLEKLTGFQPVKQFPTFHKARRFITAFKSARYLSLS